MSDYETWRKDNDIPYTSVGAEIWNASRAALIGEVEPVAWMYENLHIKGKWYLVWKKAEEEGFNEKPLYSAEALATAHAKGREAGLREALAEANYDDPYSSCDCATAIEQLLEKKP